MLQFRRVSRKTAQGAAASLFITCLGAGLRFLMLALLARVMTVEEYGLFAFVFSLALFLAILGEAGQAKLVLRFLSPYLATRDYSKAVGVIRFSLRRVIAAGSMVGAGLILAQGLLFAVGATDRFLVGVWAAILVLGMALAEYLSHLLRAMGSIVTALGPRDVLWRGGITVGAGIGAWLGQGFSVEQVLCFCTVTLWIIVLFQGWISHRFAIRTIGSAAGQKAGEAPWRDVEQQWRYATPGLAVLGVAFHAFEHLFIVVAGLVLSPAEAAHFFAASKTGLILFLPVVAANIIAGPRVASCFARHDIEGLRRVSRISIALAAPLTLLGSVILAVFGREILGLFGAGFSEAYGALLLVAVGQFGCALCGAAGGLMIMTGHERLFLRYCLISNVAGLILMVLFASSAGIMGAAAGTILAQAGRNVAVWIWARQNLGVDITVVGLLNQPRLSEASAQNNRKHDEDCA